ncbi:DEAD/DEAH box helicase [Hydrogenophilus islandicus]
MSTLEHVSPTPSSLTFADLGLPAAITAAVAQTGYTEPTAVQREAIPAVLAGEDLLVSSQTGSGKTAAFALPLLARLSQPRPDPRDRGARVLVLTPTRELAQQVEKAFRTYGQGLRRLKTVTLVGGMPFGPQRRDLAGPVDVIVATPGRLKDHLNQRTLTLSAVETLVLDEADRMLDMGFIDDIREIAVATPANRQTLLFSATLDGVVGQLARSITRNARRIEVVRTPEAAPKIAERVHYFDNETHKNQILAHLLANEAVQQAVIFTATKRSAEMLATQLQGNGIRAEALHGDMTQRARSRVVERLRRGEIQVLVATDVAARGLDVAGITHVINFDPPKQFEDYVHRIGRTGRAGREGIAITLAHPNESRLIQGIGRFVGRTLPEETIAGLEPRIPRRTGGNVRSERRSPGTSRPFAAPQKPKSDFGRSRWGDARPHDAHRSRGASRPHQEWERSDRTRWDDDAPRARRTLSIKK